MYIQLAPGRAKVGVDEATILKASDEFETHFVKQQKGIIKRILMKGKGGTYADLVFFESKEAADRVAEAEQAGHPACLDFFQLFEMDETKTDMAVLSFEDIKTYGKQV
ncbi:hypothetical protein LEP1GSC036_3964 [Leptospira weilii str. 2006001853]|uniref:ABM domain-containing protein n=2 Tax=Leptospira weilii TaxID=28184 RepID=A0A828Z4M5_9LEPT|nr:hypothetical protein [Leptospira weilii]EKR66294.1 hypothetical protein LEP1GSC036_3964 [Leptospira weilii str. 2006001853]EMN43425.1 hypothetical protein LEP1GSC086_1695 [Leptospira weilii str. LNT 1234]EMN88191.1 hypothetical protein LEP1GSC108_0482 [Leptospira weilii str. UI 13098]OMI17231.1 hypothetical protein BUQ74_11180 [Leptospira weilii serovar Heyan]QDK23912.1 hypothetical protein FHG67_15215 [Leptospira weilii]